MKTFLQNLAWAVLMLLILGAAIALDNPRGGPSPAEVRAPGRDTIPEYIHHRP